jgi:PilZ domain
MEQRWGERLTVNVPVRVSAHAFTVRDGRLTDLSVSGGHLEVDMDLRPGARVEVLVVLPYRSKHEAPAVYGYVTRKYRDGFGIEWCEFAPTAVAELLRIAVRHPYTAPQHTGIPMIRPRTAGSLLKHAE